MLQLFLYCLFPTMQAPNIKIILVSAMRKNHYNTTNNEHSLCIIDQSVLYHPFFVWLTFKCIRMCVHVRVCVCPLQHARQYIRLNPIVPSGT